MVASTVSASLSLSDPLPTTSASSRSAGRQTTKLRRSSAAVWQPYVLSDLPQRFGADPERAASLLEIVTELELPSQQGRQVAGRDDRGVLVRLLQYLACVVAAGCRHRWGVGGSGIRHHECFMGWRGLR